VLQKSPLSTEEVDLMATRAGIGAQQISDNEGEPEIWYSPFEAWHNADQALLADLIKSPNLEQIYDSTNSYIRPATDDKPFFNQTRPWNLRLGFRGVLDAGADSATQVDALPVAQVTLVVLLLQAMLVAGVMILLPLVRFNRQGLRANGRWAFLTYFAGLGAGFILIEIVLLQRLQVFLGQPIYTFSVVLAGLLIFTGLGSFLAGRIQDPTYGTLSWLLLAVVGAILFTLVIMPPVLASGLGFAFPWRIVLSVLLVAPVGVMLGMPFPTGLRLVGKTASALVPWAWAVNGFFTVIGSVGAMILGMTLGFTAVLIIAAGCYTAALIAIRVG